MRSAFSYLKGACQRSGCHTWPHVAQVKRISGIGQEHSQIEIIISLSLHHLQKFGFHPPFDLGVFFSLPLRDFGFSSSVIVIVKIHFDI